MIFSRYSNGTKILQYLIPNFGYLKKTETIGKSIFSTELRSFFRRNNTDGTLGIALVKNLAVQALMAFIWINMPFRMNCLHHAFFCATRAGIAAFLVSLEPVKHAHPCRDGECCTQWTQITAIEAFNEETSAQQHTNKENVRPGPVKL